MVEVSNIIVASQILNNRFCKVRLGFSQVGTQMQKMGHSGEYLEQFYGKTKLH